MGVTRLSRRSLLSVLTRLSSTTMTTLAQLVPLIYHERQEEGSMLCAQHALNNLLRTLPIIPHLSVSSPSNTDLRRGTFGLSLFRSVLREQPE